jgi:hypothetical protein
VQTDIVLYADFHILVTKSRSSSAQAQICNAVSPKVCMAPRTRIRTVARKGDRLRPLLHRTVGSKEKSTEIVDDISLVVKCASIIIVNLENSVAVFNECAVCGLDYCVCGPRMFGFE